MLILRSNSFPLPALPSSGEIRKTRAETSGSRHWGNAANRAQVRLSFPEGMKESLTRILLAQLPEEIAGRRAAVTVSLPDRTNALCSVAAVKGGQAEAVTRPPQAHSSPELCRDQHSHSRALQGKQQATGSSELGQF